MRRSRVARANPVGFLDLLGVSGAFLGCGGVGRIGRKVRKGRKRRKRRRKGRKKGKGGRKDEFCFHPRRAERRERSERREALKREETARSLRSSLWCCSCWC